MQPTEFIMISVVALTVIYVDVLLVVNFFITFLLLLITQKLAKENSKLVRLVLASFGGSLLDRSDRISAFRLEMFCQKHGNLLFCKFCFCRYHGRVVDDLQARRHRYKQFNRIF